MKPALFFYCQHSMGLGHLVRSWALADALSSSFHVVFASGGVSPLGVASPAAVEVVTLPPLEQTTDGEIVTREPDQLVADIQARRRRLLLDTFMATRPAVVVIELFPFGRAKFAGEILPILDHAATLVPRPVVICSVRDLLAGGRKNQQRHDDRAQAIVDRYFDAVLVHADPRLAALEETFKPTAPLQVPVMYTGFVIPRQAPSATARRDRVGVLVSAGGGRYGGPLFRSAVDAHILSTPAERLPMRIVAGPFLPDDDYEALQRLASGCDDLTIDRVVPSLRPLLESSRLSVSQCGYNTALDLLQAGLPALVVPFAEGCEDEQRVRARRLEALGSVRVLDPDALTAPRLAHELLATRRFTPASIALDLNGARETVRIINRLRHPPVPAGVRQMEYA
jgi:predicted glycosyltransferase